MIWTLRRISPADETALIEFHDRCSEDTHYLRFAAAKPQLRPAEAQYLCAVDDHGRGALVITASDDPRTIHGVGRWERLNLTDAELAFVIEDAYQGQGLGRKLVEATIERAHEEGFTNLMTDMLRSNYRMRHLARDYGLVIGAL
jgi:GNAT superfamily N-acetyltransferase